MCTSACTSGMHMWARVYALPNSSFEFNNGMAWESDYRILTFIFNHTFLYVHTELLWLWELVGVHWLMPPSGQPIPSTGGSWSMQSKRTLELLSRKYVDMHCTCIYMYVCVCVCVDSAQAIIHAGIGVSIIEYLVALIWVWISTIECLVLLTLIQYALYQQNREPPE